MKIGLSTFGTLRLADCFILFCHNVFFKQNNFSHNFFNFFQNPHFDVAYPAGVRRDSVVHTQNYGVMDGGVDTPVYNSPEAEYMPSYRSYIARPDEFAQQAAGVIVENPEDSDAVIETVSDSQPMDFGRRYRRDAASRGYEVKRDGVINPLSHENLEREVYKMYGIPQKGAKTESRFRKNSVYENPFFKAMNAYKKVQVTEEETGTQRVQVNAGYENPKITCVSGYNSCSGVLLKFVLTFHGTNELNTAQPGMPCMF